MIVSDLDGTLLNAQSQLSPRTTATIQRARDSGVIFVAATGRSQHSALELLRPSGAVTWALCSNGATKYDLHNDRLVSHTTIPASEAAGLLARLRVEFGEIGVAWETEEQLAWDQLYEDHRNALVPRPEPQEGRVVAFPAGSNLIKVLITHPSLTHDEWLEALLPFAGTEMSVSTSGTDFVEITHSTATKGQAIARLCADLGIDASEVAAFGDQVNDLDMIEWAGRGYAMANANDKVKAAASHHAPHHDDHGVAAIIDELIPPT